MGDLPTINTARKLLNSRMTLEEGRYISLLIFTRRVS